MSKIYQMAEQAAEFAVLNPSDEVLQSETDDAKVEVPKAFIDKLSELILQECIDIASDTRYDGTVVANRIKFSFGIEE